MSKQSIDDVVKGLLNGKKPSGNFISGEDSEKLATALAAKIDGGVAPSLCAHAMCGSAAAGNVAVVRMLSKLPMSTFNKAYNFGEPLRRACRAYVKATDPMQRQALAECARLITAARGDLNQPDKYLKSGMSAAQSLRTCGTAEALELLEELKAIQQLAKGDAKVTAKKDKTIALKVEGKEIHTEVKVESENNTSKPGGRKRKAVTTECDQQALTKRNAL